MASRAVATENPPSVFAVVAGVSPTFRFLRSQPTRLPLQEKVEDLSRPFLLTLRLIYSCSVRKFSLEGVTVTGF